MFYLYEGLAHGTTPKLNLGTDEDACTSVPLQDVWSHDPAFISRKSIYALNHTVSGVTWILDIAAVFIFDD